MLTYILIKGAKVLAKDVSTGPVETLGGEIINLIKTRSFVKGYWHLFGSIYVTTLQHG